MHWFWLPLASNNWFWPLLNTRYFHFVFKVSDFWAWQAEDVLIFVLRRKKTLSWIIDRPSIPFIISMVLTKVLWYKSTVTFWFCHHLRGCFFIWRPIGSLLSSDKKYRFSCSFCFCFELNTKNGIMAKLLFPAKKIDMFTSSLNDKIYA